MFFDVFSPYLCLGKINESKVKMKKKIRHALAELSKECVTLPHQEMRSVVGGDRYTFDSSGMLIGYEKSDDNWVSVGGNSMQISAPLDGLDSEHGSCATFSGSGVSASLFEFLANNTNVEWAYAFNAEQGGGMMTTSNEAHSVNTSGINFDNYDSIVHNHGQRPDGMTDEEMEQFNSLPSSQDIDELNARDGLQGHVYNEVTGEWNSYDKESSTQEDWLRNNGFTWDEWAKAWVRV